jgi:hypothetical protein
MRHGFTVVLSLATCLSVSAFTAMGQMHPGRHGYYGQRASGGYGGYDDYYGGNDAWGAVASAMNTTSSRYAAQQDRMAGQAAADMQRGMMQSNIRNTLSTQAEMRTQNIIGQGEANRDWWFQVQQQQAAQRQSMAAAHAPIAMMSAAGLEAVSSPTPQPSAATDVIKWQSTLCEPRFSADRAKVEAPYRRAPKGKAAPTTADYQNMIDAAQHMKLLLGQMTADISAQDYLGAEKFLDQLAAEAHGRIEQGKKPAEQPDK